jgi:hypothetical protein
MGTNYTNTLAGMLLLNDQNLADIYPSEVLDDAPVVAKAIAIPASQGTQHKYIRRNTAAGATFRLLNTGVNNAAEVFEDVTLNCKLLDASYTRDVGLAMAYKKGLSAYIQKETLGALKSAMYAIEYALFNNDKPTAFSGFGQFETLQDTDLGQVVSAGGAGGKSVYLLRWGEDAAAIVAGNEGRIDMIWDDNSPTIVQVVQTGSLVYSAYRVTLGGWFGLQLGSKYDAVRIANLDGTSDDLLTDDLISEAISKFPAARPPNMIVMNRTSLKELQQSRTATNPTGAPAPFPSEAFGVPIVVTDALGTGESTVDATTTTTTTSSSV